MQNTVFCATRSGEQLLQRTLKFLKINYEFPDEQITVVPFGFQRFPNSEFKVVGQGNLRDKNVHLFTSICQESPKISVSEDTMELLQMLDAIQRAGAEKLTIYFGYLPWQRQEKKAPKEAISASLFFNLVNAAAPKILRRFCSVNLHAEAIQGFTNLPFDVVSSLPLHVLRFRTLLTDKKNLFIAVSNDEGGADMIREFARDSGASGTVIMKKHRDENNEPTTNILDGREFIKDYQYFVIGDDEISSGDSLINTRRILLCINPKAIIYAFADHGLFNFKAGMFAEQKLYEQRFKVFTTDTIPRSQEYYDTSYKWLQVATIAPFLADLVYCNIYAESFSAKYQQHRKDVLEEKSKIEDYLISITPKELIAK